MERRRCAAENSAAVSVSVEKSRRAVATARWPATNSTRYPWRTFSVLRSKTAADLSGLAHVRATAGGEVEVADVDEAELVALGGRKFAQAECSGFIAGHKADFDRAILEHDFVGESLGGFDLIFAKRGRVEIDRAIVVGHVERDGRHVEKANEGGGENVLGGVLLHVVAAAGGVDFAANAGSGLYVFQWSFEVVDDVAVFGVGDFGDAEFRVHVASAGTIQPVSWIWPPLVG